MFDAGDERIYGWRRKRLALETTPYSSDEFVEKLRSLYVAFDQYCICIYIYIAIYTQLCSLLD